MSGISYIYASTTTRTQSFDLGSLTAPSGGILKVTTGADIATPSIATPGVDYLTSVGVDSTTGLVVTGSPLGANGTIHVNFPLNGHASILLGNGTTYSALAAGAVGDVLTVTDDEPFATVAWAPGSGGGSSTYLTLLSAVNPPLPVTGAGVFNVLDGFPQFTSNEVCPDTNAIVTCTISGDEGLYGALGTVLIGNGLDYQAFGDDTTPAGSALTSAGGGTFSWTPITVTNPISLPSLPLPTPPGAGIGLISVSNTNTLPYFTNSDDTYWFTTVNDDAATGYGNAGTLLVGYPASPSPSYGVLAPGSINQVLTVTGVGPAVLGWETPSSGAPLALEVDCVLWISPGYAAAEIPYTYVDGEITFTGPGLPPQIFDNFLSITVGSRVLFVDQSNLQNNGIYEVASFNIENVATMTRTTDFDNAGQMIYGTTVCATPFVNPVTDPGLAPALSTFSGQNFTFITQGSITVGTTPLVFSTTVFSGVSSIVMDVFNHEIVSGGGTYNIISRMPGGGRKFITTAITLGFNGAFPGPTCNFTFGVWDVIGTTYYQFTPAIEVTDATGSSLDYYLPPFLTAAPNITMSPTIEPAMSTDTTITLNDFQITYFGRWIDFNY